MAQQSEALLVGDEAEHPVDAFLGEFGHRATLGADEVAMVVVRRTRLEAAGPVAEVVGARQAGEDQEIEGPVERRRPDPQSRAVEEPLQPFHGEVLVGGEEGGRDLVPLACDREMSCTEPGPELFQKLGASIPTEAHQGR